jgi:hypothetical protein
MTIITGSLVGLMVLLFAAAVLVFWVGDSSGSSSGEVWGAAILVAAFGFPVVIAAIFGGLAISSWGWVPGTIFGGGWMALLVFITNGSSHLMYDGETIGLFEYREQVWQTAGIGGLVVGGALFFVAGWISGVPMWIGGTSGGISITKGRKNTERRPRPDRQ